MNIWFLFTLNIWNLFSTWHWNNKLIKSMSLMSSPWKDLFYYWHFWYCLIDCERHNTSRLSKLGWWEIIRISSGGLNLFHVSCCFWHLDNFWEFSSVIFMDLSLSKSCSCVRVLCFWLQFLCVDGMLYYSAQLNFIFYE